MIALMRAIFDVLLEAQKVDMEMVGELDELQEAFQKLTQRN